MKEQVSMTHGFRLSTGPDAEGVKRSIDVNKRSDGAFQIVITTTSADGQPFETHVGLSRVGMELLVRACNEAALNMHEWPIPDDLPEEGAKA